MWIRRRGRKHHVFFAPSPEDCSGNKHQNTRNPECDRRTEWAQKDRHQKRREERAEVDDPVKGLEHYLGAVFVSLVELVPDKRRNTRFDPPRAKRDQPKADVKSGAIGSKHRQARLAYAVNQA